MKLRAIYIQLFYILRDRLRQFTSVGVVESARVVCNITFRVSYLEVVSLSHFMYIAIN